MRNKTKNKVLIDASWWLGGNKKRGIGKFLEYFFLEHWDVRSAQRVWLFPCQLADAQKKEFQQKFAGKVVELSSTTGITPNKKELLGVVKQNKIGAVFIGSPFERPWSLLNELPALDNSKLETIVLVHDLIPFRFPKMVLRVWSKSDQQQYLINVEFLKNASQIICTSPYSAKEVAEALGVPVKKVRTLKFSTQLDWIKAYALTNEEKELPVVKPLAVTISGGEWRKNLGATLKYFARNLAQSHRLIVICKLGTREKIKFYFLSWLMGISSEVKFAGEVTEKQKWQYLYNCDLFLFLSKAEGLGIPLLEARKAGVRKFVISQQLKEAGFDKLLKNCRVEVSNF